MMIDTEQYSFQLILHSGNAVSYTHLDVYKRQCYWKDAETGR